MPCLPRNAAPRRSTAGRTALAMPGQTPPASPQPARPLLDLRLHAYLELTPERPTVLATLTGPRLPNHNRALSAIARHCLPNSACHACIAMPCQFSRRRNLMHLDVPRLSCFFEKVPGLDDFTQQGFEPLDQTGEFLIEHRSDVAATLDCPAASIDFGQYNGKRILLRALDTGHRPVALRVGLGIRIADIKRR